jgi:betaine-aldehyde dehydrogenase
MNMEARLLINGRWVPTRSHGTRFNPATGAAIGTYAEAGETEAQAAISAARTAFEQASWAQNPRLRQQVMLRWADEMERRAEELARLLTLENGKVLGQSRGEVAAAISEVRYYAGLAFSAPC